MSKYTLNYAGVGEMLCMEAIQADMHRRAEAVMAAAEASAPVDEKGLHPGRYKRSFSVSSGVRSGRTGRRAYGRVSNSAPEARFVEFGTKNNQRYRTLGKALDAAGDL